jgi:hypothetical protein
VPKCEEVKLPKVLLFTEGDEKSILASYIEHNYEVDVLLYYCSVTVDDLVDINDFDNIVFSMVINSEFPKYLYLFIKEASRDGEVVWFWYDVNEEAPDPLIARYPSENIMVNMHAKTMGEFIKKIDVWKIFNDVLEKYLGEYKKE